MRKLLLLSVLFLSACGFHLRGSQPLPVSELALRDATPPTDIYLELSRALADHGIQVSDAAPLVLQLNGESYGKRVLAVTSTGRAQEYGLRYVLHFSLQRADGSMRLKDETVEASRDLQFDESAVLAMASEEARLHAEMRRDVVDQVLRILRHVKPQGDN